MNVVFIVGSLRADSVNAKLAVAASEHLPENASATIYPDLEKLPMYNQDEDTEPAPAAAAHFRDAVSAADALVVVTPEYNGSMSGAIKNAIDWASRPRGAASIDGKPVAVLGASMSPRAAQWAREDAIKVLTVAGAKPLPTSVGLGNAANAFTPDGSLVDADVDAAVAALMGELAAVDQAA